MPSNETPAAPTVAEVMSRDVEFVAPDATVRDAATTMAEYDVGAVDAAAGAPHLLVVGDGGGGRPEVDDEGEVGLVEAHPQRGGGHQRAQPVLAQVLFQLLSDPELLMRCADGVLSAEEQQLLLWSRPPRSKGTARWSAADTALLDELTNCYAATPKVLREHLSRAAERDLPFVYLYVTTHGTPSPPICVKVWVLRSIHWTM